MRLPLALCLLTLAACATGNGGAPEATRERVDVKDSGPMSLEVGTLRDSHEQAVPAPLAEVLRVLPLVLDSLGIPVATRDASTGVVGNSGFEVRRVLGRTMVNRYFDCGEARGGSSAMSYDLYVSVLSRARANASGGTDLLTTTTVRARPVAYSGSWIPCASLGLLEQRVADAVTERVRKK